jgi:hypothetical protein
MAGNRLFKQHKKPRSKIRRNSPDVIRNYQSGYVWPLNTSFVFRGIPAKN